MRPKAFVDFAHLWTLERSRYVAALIELLSGAWLADECRNGRVTDALAMAIWVAEKTDAPLHHSVRGSRYASEQLRRLMARRDGEFFSSRNNERTS